MVASSNPQPKPSGVDFSQSRRSLVGRRGGVSASTTDKLFYGITLTFAASVLVISVLIGIQLWRASAPAMAEFGAGFLTSTEWNPGSEKGQYGALPFVFGTLVSSFLALLIAVPIGIGCAIFLAELAPRWIRTPLSFAVELLAAVPSVVYGLWGLRVMTPWLRERQEFILPGVYKTLVGWETGLVNLTGIKAFSTFGLSNLIGNPEDAVVGTHMLAGGLVLAVMVLPFITAVSREVIKAVPSTQREAAYGLGATRWEAIKGPVLKYARSGIIGAIILALARALGETMAITMVIGNSDEISPSLFSSASTLSSKLANEFNEASGLQLSALMYLALVLFGITVIVNALARLLIWNMSRSVKGATRI